VCFWRRVGFGSCAGSRNLLCRAKQAFWLDEGWRTFIGHLHIGLGSAGFPTHLRDGGANCSGLGRGLFGQVGLMLDIVRRVRWNRHWFLREDWLQARDRLVFFADQHQDEREEDRNPQDATQDADDDFLGFAHGVPPQE